MNQNGRERSIPCQRKSPGEQVGTRIPLPLSITRQPLLERISPAAIAEDTSFHLPRRRKLIFDENYKEETPLAVPLSNTTETLSPKDDDLDSLRSYGSVCTTMSCDHAHFARNGTTFSGRRGKFVVHCSSYSGETEQYLTPTQRANKQIRTLKMLLSETKKESQKKDQIIFRLMKELMELRLYKASLTDSEEVPGSSEDLNSVQDTDADPNDTLKGETVKAICADSESYIENSQDSASGQENVQISPSLLLIEKIAVDLPSSLTDSGHFEETASSSSANPKDSTSLQQTVKDHARDDVLEHREDEIAYCHMWQKKLDELQREYLNECLEHNDKVQKLLQNLSDAKERYYELHSEYEKAQDKIRKLEKDGESLTKSLEEQEERHKSMYLKMYTKGQEAARFEHADQVLEFAHRAPSRVSVPELLQQLQITENELENLKAMNRKIVGTRTGTSDIDPVITLQFLKSAIYHFLTAKENYQGHLNAIEDILGYSENERLNIQKAYRSHAKK